MTKVRGRSSFEEYANEKTGDGSPHREKQVVLFRIGIADGKPSGTIINECVKPTAINIACTARRNSQSPSFIVANDDRN